MREGAFPLYDPAMEHDACGTGFVAQVSGQPSHAIVQLAAEALANLMHRGAMDAEATSDGAGIMAGLPYAIIADWLENQQLPPVAREQLAILMAFLPGDLDAQDQCLAVIGSLVSPRQIAVCGVRPVPVDSACLTGGAQATCPHIVQVVLRDTAANAATFEARLWLLRRAVEQQLAAHVPAGFAIPSCSSRTLVYKGLLPADRVAVFYHDLADPRYTSSFALFHQRYSTNTFPSWRLAQPFRFLAHNGEINTVQGNRHWMANREKRALKRRWGEDAAWLQPIVEAGGSDSTSLDNVLEWLVASDFDVLHALAILVPEAWEGHTELSAEVRAFYAFHAPAMEPWDGPAALVFADGHYVGAMLDRNGLRPLRYQLSPDGILVVGSETGIVNIPAVRKGRLGPGQMIAVDLARGVLLGDAAIKRELAGRQRYVTWVKRHQTSVVASDLPPPAPRSARDLLMAQARFGMTHEDVEFVLRPMVTDQVEATWSMGDDTPLAALSAQPRVLSSYFRQRFAQVTNPPIDSLRERSVMALTTYLGQRGGLVARGESPQQVLVLASPILREGGVEELTLVARQQHLRPIHLAATYLCHPAGDPAADTEQRATSHHALQQALAHLATQATAAVRAGTGLIVLDDRADATEGAPLPMVLAVAAVHQALFALGLRQQVGIVALTGAAWDTHQVALLIGFGADAVSPALALATARSFAGTRGLEDLTPRTAQGAVIAALEKGLLKIMARMGLSTVESYRGAQLFEAIGLTPELVAHYFPGIPLLPGWHDLAAIDRGVALALAESIALRDAEGPAARLKDRGYQRFRRDGEYHAANPIVVRALQKAARTGSSEAYVAYTDLVQGRAPTTVRDLLAFVEGHPIPLDEVEPALAITRRFVSSAMSLGALSPEAHLALTLGMHRVGGKSNTGEGGEDPAFFQDARAGFSTNSRIKQVSSGRFGVTTAYLAHAEELEIKMAQGSKPGEGGQIPARKVTELIARLRHTSPGVPLISPPPHHDIYSIEDLAQLIFDLKQVNPRAKIGVKLVAEHGVGTVAAGVAKAHADYILISGHDGGTGASPLSSIKHAGDPWEWGLAEAQQVLRLNGLRGRVRLRTDGGLKTGRDVLIAALLGADEYGFGTAALIALGCDMARQCHLDTCPAGIATQRPDLRQKFDGQPEHVAAFLLAVAEEVRGLLARLGFRTLEAVIGRTDLLTHAQGDRMPLDLAPLLAPGPAEGPRRWLGLPVPTLVAGQAETQLLDDALPLLERGHGVLLHAPIRNRDRAVGARLAGAIALRWGDGGLPSGSITAHYTGSAGQSFGAFCVPGLRLILAGDANDYVGKGMTGGLIVIAPPPHSLADPHSQAIVGNTVLYGATGGIFMAYGRAGERFAVRNSGALAVVEGIGDHGCEYMTGGAVIVLGAIGRNFGAGMTGGIAYLFDRTGEQVRQINAETVSTERGLAPADARAVAQLLRHYLAQTGSAVAAGLLADWPKVVGSFWRVVPRGDVPQHAIDDQIATLGVMVAPLPLVAGGQV